MTISIAEEEAGANSRPGRLYPSLWTWVARAAALLIFTVLILWHFAPVLPYLTTHVPMGGTFDTYNFVAAPLTVARSVLRHPWCFWRGDRPYPEEFATTLHQVDYPYSFVFYALYQMLRNPLLVFNLMAMLLYLANAWCTYALVRRWSGEWVAGIFAGVACAFFAYGFYCMELDILVMYITALALLCWVNWLEVGGWWRLLAWYGALALKTTTPDYQGVFLALLFSIAVPLGFVAYPERWRRERKRFVVGSVVFVILMLPFVYPYLRVLSRYQGHGWRGIMFVNCEYLTKAAWLGVWRDFWHVITHPRTQSSPDPWYFMWPGVVWQVSMGAGVLWGVLAPLVQGRRGFLRWALVCGAGLAGCLAFSQHIRLGDFGPLSRLYVDPPILAVVRAPRAFIFSGHLCLTILAGLAMGDALRGLRRWRGAWLVAGVLAGAWTLLYTLENTVRLRPLTRYDAMLNLPPAYQWLRAQKYPSPFIEFPYRTGFDMYVKGALSALADQPSAKGRSRYVMPLHYYLAEVSEMPLATRAAFVSASPYRFWIQEGAGEEERRVVETSSDLRYATNFGATVVWENPAPCKTGPIEMVLTQRYAVTLPQVIYTVGVEFLSAGEFCYVPAKERNFWVGVRVLDGEGTELARLRLREELPFVVSGPRWEVGVQVQYERAAGRLVGRLLRPGKWRIARAPVGRARFSDEKMAAARWLDLEARRPGTGQKVSLRVPVSQLSPRWPYACGVPVSYAYQAGGFDVIEREERPYQRSVGRESTLCLPRPAGEPGAVAVTLRSAVPFVREGVRVRVTLNGVELGEVNAGAAWERHMLAVPRGTWREMNWLVLSYPKTYVPCVTQGGGDDQRRCIALGEVEAVEVPEAREPSREVRMAWEKNLLRNGSFEEGFGGWLPWRDERITNTVWFVRHEGVSAVCLVNPGGGLGGLQQLVQVRTGGVYRLSARVRGHGNIAGQLLGARAAVWLPPQPEPQLIWLYAPADWQAQSVVFTNQVDGVACVYVHLGYGQVASTAEFTDVRLEELTP